MDLQSSLWFCCKVAISTLKDFFLRKPYWSQEYLLISRILIDLKNPYFRNPYWSLETLLTSIILIYLRNSHWKKINSINLRSIKEPIPNISNWKEINTISSHKELFLLLYQMPESVSEYHHRMKNCNPLSLVCLDLIIITRNTNIRSHWQNIISVPIVEN